VATTNCKNCGETADSAKAFCPACGDALVAEDVRESASEFDASARTVQFGSTIYNQLLSEMGLNISESPNKPALHPEPLAPAAPVPERKDTPVQATRSTRRRWLLIGILAFVFLTVVGAVLLAAGIFLYLRWDQLQF